MQNKKKKAKKKLIVVNDKTKKFKNPCEYMAL